MLLGGAAAVLTVHHAAVIGIRTYNSQLLDVLVKRQDAVVLKQYH